MSVDYTFLECVRGADLAQVAEAIETSLATGGWVPGVSATEADRPIQLMQSGKWIVIDDRYDLASTRWAEGLSETLAAEAISLRIMMGEYSLWRFNRGKLVGKADNGEAARKTAELERMNKLGEAARAFDRKVLVRTAFLADLASGAARAKLTKGLRFAPSEVDESLLAIAKLAKLPEPLDRYYEADADLQLCFRPGPPPRRTPTKSSPKKKRSAAALVAASRNTR